MHDHYTYNIYQDDSTGFTGAWHYGEVIAQRSGQREYQTSSYPDEESVVNACLDWIDDSLRESEESVFDALEEEDA
jgi:hypothetical protein